MKSTIESRGMIVMRKDSVAEYGQVYFLKCKRKTQTIRQRQAIRQIQTKSQKRHKKRQTQKRKNVQQSREQMEKACPAKFTLCKFPMSMFGGNARSSRNWILIVQSFERNQR